MRYRQQLIVFLFVCFLFACGDSEPATPAETLKAYQIAIQKKDVAMIKLLLSSASIKIHEEQAKAQNTSIDEIILRETLFPAEQRIFDYKDEKIEGDRATVDVKNDFGGWDTIFLIREGGIWKIDKKGFSEEIIEQNEEADKKLDEQLEQMREQSNEANENTEPANDENPDDEDKQTPLDPKRQASEPQTTPEMPDERGVQQ